MRQRSRLRNLAEYWAATLVLLTLGRGPKALAESLARLYMATLDFAVPRLRKTAFRNLEIALPDLPTAKRSEIADGVFRSLARLLVSFARFPKMTHENVAEWIRYEGLEHFENARKRGRGILIATGHLGNWELSAFAHALMAGPMHVVVRRLDNPLLDALVERRRMLSGNQMIEKKDLARGIMAALGRNEAVGILVDQNSSTEVGVFVDFFGVPACANGGFARMAAHTGAAVIPGCALWSRDEKRYVLRFYPPVEITGDVKADTQRVQKRIEEIIRRDPDQWLWIHRRWKTRPPGSETLY